MDRLTDRNKEMPTPISDHAAYYARCVNKLADYEDTGRTPEEIQNAIFPPCKVGETVWRIVGRGTNGHRSVQQRKVLAVTIYHTGDMIIHTDGAENRFGKTVFLTCEEAEAALGGGGDAVP